MLRSLFKSRPFSSTRLSSANYVMGTPGFTDQTPFTQIIDEFPKPCERNYFNTFKSWTKTEIEEAVFGVLLDNTTVDIDNVLVIGGE